MTRAQESGLRLHGHPRWGQRSPAHRPALVCPSQPCNLLGGGDKSYLTDLIKFLIYTPINSSGLLAMCLKLYLPKDSLLSIDQGPDSHKLWGHVCDWEEDRERGSRTPGCSRTVRTYGRVACDRKDMSCRLLLEQHTCLFMKCCGSDSICLNS